MILPHFLFTLSSTPEHIAYDRWEDPNLVDRLLSRHASMLTKSITLVPLLIVICIERCQEKKFKILCSPNPSPLSQQAGEVYLRCTGINDYLASLCERSSNTVTDLQKRIHLCKTSLTWTLEDCKDDGTLHL